MHGLERRVLKGDDPVAITLHMLSTPENRCEVNSTGEHLLPFIFFFKAKLPYGYFKMGIWNRGQGANKRLILMGRPKCVGGGGATYDQ